MATSQQRVPAVRDPVVSRALPRNPERVAWTVLLSAFFTFVAVLATLVFGGQWWLQYAAVAQLINNVPTGTVQVTRPGRNTSEVNLQEIPVGSVIATEANALANLTFTAPRTQQVVASVQIYGDSQVFIEQANSPRFATGRNPHRIVLEVRGGRVRAYVGVDVDHPVEVEIHSEPGAVTLLNIEGSNATVDASFTETMVTVREGEATVSANDGSVVLAKDQRAEVTTAGPPSGPLPADRNLIKNGDFAVPLDGLWRIETAQSDPAEEPGSVEWKVIGGRRTIRFARVGRNWGSAGITQDINQNLQGYSSLRLNMDLLIAFQDLWNCGANGTECPLMVRITFTDVYGNPQEWLHGFFYRYSPDPSLGPTYCASCWTAQWQHEEWPYGTWQVYESENLLEVFEERGTPLATIRSITLYGSGHTFNSFVTDVQLLAAQ